MTRPDVLPSAICTVSAPRIGNFRGSMAGLCAPLSTLRRGPRGQLRMTRGRCGSLLLHRKGLAPSTPCRSPGASQMFSGLPPKADLPAEHSGQTFYNEALCQLHEADAGLRRQAAIAKCKAMGRPDPYQERAREMTREAGLDPDGLCARRQDGLPVDRGRSAVRRRGSPCSRTSAPRAASSSPSSTR